MITCQERVAPAALNTASLSITLSPHFTALGMDCSKKPVYGMLMTVLFYTTGFICGVRTALWLAMHTLLPAISRIVALYYHPSSSSDPAPPSPTAGGMMSNSRKGASSGQFFKLVHTAAGHDLLVPVPVPTSTYHIGALTASGSSSSAVHILARLALLLSLIGAAYYYFVSFYPLKPFLFYIDLGVQCRSPTWIRARKFTPRNITPFSTGLSSVKTTTRKLNPAAPAFTPSAATPTLHHRLDPTARTFAPASPADSSMDSAGPATPSPSSATRVAHVGKSGGTGWRVPVGVGKMRVVRPEEVVDGERRVGEVFVFF